MRNQSELCLGHRLEVGNLLGIPIKLAKTKNQQLTNGG